MKALVKKVILATLFLVFCCVTSNILGVPFITGIPKAIVILLILVYVNRFYYAVLKVNCIRYLIMAFMVLVSNISLIISIYFTNILLNFLNFDIVLTKWFGLFSENLEVMEVNFIFASSILVFYPAYHIYAFLLVIIKALSERWFGKKTLYKEVAMYYDRKIILTYFNVLIVFMGLLPLFAAEVLANSFNKIPLIILLFSLLPSAHLSFTQAKK